MQPNNFTQQVITKAPEISTNYIDMQNVIATLTPIDRSAIPSTLKRLTDEMVKA